MQPTNSLGSRSNQGSTARLAMAWLALALVCPGGMIDACQIPVFRYALERWQPDSYHAYVVHDGALSPPQRMLVERLTAAGTNADRPINLATETIDLADPENRVWRQRLPADLPLPALVVRYPTHLGNPAPGWTGPFSEENVTRLVDSPVRQEIARRILKGESAVWVLLESGDATADDQAYETLLQELTRAQSQLRLPDINDIKNDAFYRADTKIDLKLEFSVLRLTQDDPAESIFRELLRHSEPGLEDLSAPCAIPIYGRGRTYFALVGAGISRENIDDNCRFLVGACSCQVKAQNPGVDLPMAVAWSKGVTDHIQPDVVLPELSGLGGLEPALTDTPASVPPAPASPAASPAPVTSVPHALPSDNGLTTQLFYGMLAIVAGMLLIVALASYWIRQRAVS